MAGSHNSKGAPPYSGQLTNIPRFFTFLQLIPNPTLINDSLSIGNSYEYSQFYGYKLNNNHHHLWHMDSTEYFSASIKHLLDKSGFNQVQNIFLKKSSTSCGEYSKMFVPA